ncbi:MAG: LEA type 2 family protein [Bacteroidales bacterium]|nr:LEA type 2 family protein [Bacteroidales bacterium]
MKKILLAIFSLILILPSCDILQQVGEMQMLSKCEFRINTVTDIHLAGVNVSNKQDISDVNTMDVLMLTNGVLSNNLPLNLKLNLQVKNPNDQTASLNRIDWVLFIDDLQMIEGTINERFSVGPNATSMLPVQIGFNLAEALSDERADTIIDFALGLAEGSGKTTRVMIKLKPSVMVGQRSIMYPGWIEVRNDFTAQ